MATTAPSAYQFSFFSIADSASQAVGTTTSKPYSTTMPLPAGVSTLYGMITVFSVNYGALATQSWMSDTNAWHLTGTFNAGSFAAWNVADVTCDANVNNSVFPATDTTNASTAGAVAKTFAGLATMPSTSYNCANQGFATNASMRCTYVFTLSGYYPAGMMCAA